MKRIIAFDFFRAINLFIFYIFEVKFNLDINKTNGLDKNHFVIVQFSGIIVKGNQKKNNVQQCYFSEKKYNFSTARRIKKL